jgi:hypothetical protein
MQSKLSNNESTLSSSEIENGSSKYAHHLGAVECRRVFRAFSIVRSLLSSWYIEAWTLVEE